VDEDGRRFQDDGDRLFRCHTRRVCLLGLANDVLESLLNPVPVTNPIRASEMAL
jgi:hypothetical protein